MSGDSDSSFSDGDYYDVDYATYYNETEDFTDDIQIKVQEKLLATESDIQDSFSSAIESFSCTESNIDEPYKDLSDVTYTIDNNADSTKNLTSGSLDSNNYANTSSSIKCYSIIGNAYNREQMTRNAPLHTTTYDEKTTKQEKQTDHTTIYDEKTKQEEQTDHTTIYDEKTKQEEPTDRTTICDEKTKQEEPTDRTTICDEKTKQEEQTDHTIICDEKTKQEEKTDHTTIYGKKTKLGEETDLNRKFTPKTLNKLRLLLFDETHSNGDQEFYIGDLLHEVESKLMMLPKEKKRVPKKPEGNTVIKPKKPKQKKLKVLSRYAIRSMAVKRYYHIQNMEILASSMSKEFIELDAMIEYFRKVNSDFESEFNRPNTPLGEAKWVSQRMDDVFRKFKDGIPLLQDCYKEVKHCLSLYVKNDKTLSDDLLKNIDMYFINSRVRDVLRVQYGKILDKFRKSNRLHCEF